MVVHYGCEIPEELYYHLKHNTWIRFEDDRTACLGMTDMAQLPPWSTRLAADN